jgi:hypothetical protein
MIETEISIFFWIILGAFTIGAAALATATLVNVLRLRNVRLSWAAGKMNGYPLFSTLFLGSVGIVGAAAFWYGSAEEMAAAGLYAWLGICWFTTSYLATKRFVTDNGIVKNVNEPSQTVAWHQIRDFVEKEKQYHTDYIFIYGLEDGFNTDGLIRLELSVPSSRKDAFQKLISHKLGSRIRCYVKEDIDIEEQFNKL